MIRKYKNYTLQTNPWHHEEEPQINENQKTAGRQSRAANSLFTIKMISKHERNSSTAQQNMKQT